MAKRLLKDLWGGGFDILFFVDNDTKKHGLSISIDNKEYPIKSTDEIKFTDFDKIVISSRCGEDILRQLQFELKVPLEKNR